MLECVPSFFVLCKMFIKQGSPGGVHVKDEGAGLMDLKHSV